MIVYDFKRFGFSLFLTYNFLLLPIKFSRNPISSCHCRGRNLGWSRHSFMPPKLGNALPLLINVRKWADSMFTEGPWHNFIQVKVKEAFLAELKLRLTKSYSSHSKMLGEDESWHYWKLAINLLLKLVFSISSKIENVVLK